MSRELLKRVIAVCSDEGSRSNISTDLYCAITEYLEMPEPEPVAWMWGDGLEVYFENSGDPDHNWVPLYTTPPDQSTRIAELEKQLEIERMRLAGCGVAAMSNTDESVKARINNLSPFWSASYGDVCAAVDREMSLRKQLAALQAKRERLSDSKIIEIMGDRFPAETIAFYEGFRDAEKAHGIGVNHE